MPLFDVDENVQNNKRDSHSDQCRSVMKQKGTENGTEPIAMIYDRIMIDQYP